jgi:hypothetical protein
VILAALAVAAARIVSIGRCMVLLKSTSKWTELTRMADSADPAKN